jgi:hypothetical protein
MSLQDEEVPLFRTLRSWSLKVLHLNRESIDRTALSQVLKDGGDEIDRLTDQLAAATATIKDLTLAEDGAKTAYGTLIQKNEDLTEELARANALIQDNINVIRSQAAECADRNDALRARVAMLEESLEILRRYAVDSNHVKYGTLSATLVKDVADKALTATESTDYRKRIENSALERAAQVFDSIAWKGNVARRIRDLKG